MRENIFKKSKKVEIHQEKLRNVRKESKKKIKLDRKYSECPTAEKEIKRNDEMG